MFGSRRLRRLCIPGIYAEVSCGLGLAQSYVTINLSGYFSRKYYQMFNQIKTPRGLEIIAGWGHLPINMVQSEIGDVQSIAADIKIREQY